MPDGPSTNWDEIELVLPLIDEFAAIVLDAMRKLYATEPIMGSGSLNAGLRSMNSTAVQYDAAQKNRVKVIYLDPVFSFLTLQKHLYGKAAAKITGVRVMPSWWS